LILNNIEIINNTQNMTEDIDQEWIDIHSWITSIRHDKKLSIFDKNNYSTKSVEVLF
jgi:hypothetical protein